MTAHIERIQRFLLLTASLSVAGIGVGACSGSDKANPGRNGSSSSAGYVFGDADDDDHDLGGEARDKDDVVIRMYGREGTAEERAAVTPVLARYFAAAAQADGANACSVLSGRLRASSNLEAFLPGDYRPAAGSSLFRNKDCARIESLLFESNRQQLQLESTTLRVTDVRVKGDHALAVMRFKTIGERQIPLILERRRWKVDGLIDEAVP